MISLARREMLLNAVLCGLMLMTALATKVVTPPKFSETQHETLHLKEIIPDHVGNWVIDPSVVPVQLSEDMQKTLNSLYSDVLVRTYVNPAGERVMMSVAYGGDQSGNLALHKPETCYGAQGFEISHFSRDQFSSPTATFPVTHLLAVQGHRSEPITYWTTVGDKVVRDGLEQKLQKLRYAMTGKIPDGILVRLSTLDNDINNSYRVQNEFIQSLLLAIKQDDRKKIIGIDS
jgi:EpsI family protein